MSGALQIAFTNLRSFGVGAPYWISKITSSGNSIQGTGICSDSSGNVYVSGSVGTGTAYGVYLIKYSLSGVVQWQRTVTFTSYTQSPVESVVAVDSSGNVYVTYRFVNNSGGSANISASLMKYDSSGVLQWSKSYKYGGTTDLFYGISIDSSGNVYINITTGGNYALATVKFNSSGVLQWNSGINTNTGNSTQQLAVDSSGNTYAAIVQVNSGSRYCAGVVKRDSSGNVVWAKSLTPSSSSYFVEGYGAAVDLSGNVYLCGTGRQGATNRYDGLLAKYNSSGTLQWQVALVNTDGTRLDTAVVDSSGNVYVSGKTSTGTPPSPGFIAKYNSSGTLQWQRIITSNTLERVGIAIDSSDNIYLTSYSSTTGGAPYVAWAFKLKNDGSGTGTYTVGGSTVVYAASSLTSSTSSYSDTTVSYGTNANTITDSTITYTDAAGSTTSSVTNI
jgi:hypothetical protein